MRGREPDGLCRLSVRLVEPVTYTETGLTESFRPGSTPGPRIYAGPTLRACDSKRHPHLVEQIKRQGPEESAKKKNERQDCT